MNQRLTVSLANCVCFAMLMTKYALNSQKFTFN